MSASDAGVIPPAHRGGQPGASATEPRPRPAAAPPDEDDRRTPSTTIHRTRRLRGARWPAQACWGWAPSGSAARPGGRAATTGRRQCSTADLGAQLKAARRAPASATRTVVLTNTGQPHLHGRRLRRPGAAGRAPPGRADRPAPAAPAGAQTVTLAPGGSARSLLHWTVDPGGRRERRDVRADRGDRRRHAAEPDHGAALRPWTFGAGVPARADRAERLRRRLGRLLTPGRPPGGFRPGGPALGSGSARRCRCPSGSRASTVPPCRSRPPGPAPAPARCRRRLRALGLRYSSSQMCGRSSAGMPGPVSATSTTTVPAASRARTSIRSPGAVYLIALSTRLPTASASRSAVPAAPGQRPGRPRQVEADAAIGRAGCSRAMSIASSSSAATSTGRRSSSAALDVGDLAQVGGQPAQPHHLRLDAGRPASRSAPAAVARRWPAAARIAVSGFFSSWSSRESSSRRSSAPAAALLVQPPPPLRSRPRPRAPGRAGPAG